MDGSEDLAGDDPALADGSLRARPEAAMRLAAMAVMLLVAGPMVRPTTAHAASPVPLPDRRPAVVSSLQNETQVRTKSAEAGSRRSSDLPTVDDADALDPSRMIIPPIRRVRPTIPPKPPALQRWLSSI
ncbi:MAG: hypothetical protein AAFR23_03875 [Pseudomonadota bacterium]